VGLLRREEFDSIPERIRCIETTKIRERLIVHNRHTGVGQARSQSIEALDDERRVSLQGWPEVTLDAEVDPNVGRLEPTAAPHFQV
jgi:hypothetical protein